MTHSRLFSRAILLLYWFGSHCSASMTNNNDIIVRFYFVRHGETQANLDGIVVGQLDSPLTKLGEAQAKAASKSPVLPTLFWRQYASDLGRAEMTARLILESRGITTLLLDQRLRERAKGVREGLSKKWDYDRATNYRKENNQDPEAFLYETEDDVWDRMQEFLREVVADAVQHFAQETETRSQLAATAESESTSGAGTAAELEKESSPAAALVAERQEQPRVYPVFCLSHSGAMRACIRNLVGSQLPSSIDLTPAGKDGAKPGMLYIPNTSITIVDITPKEEVADDESDLDARLVELTHADHLNTL